MNTSERRNQPTETIVTCVYCGMAYPQGTPTHGATVLTEHIKVCEKHPMRELEQQLAAANARVAELEKDNARQKRLATISRLCKNVQACRAEKAEAKILQMEDAIRFDFERFMEFQQRAEQAENRMKRMEDALREIASFDGWKSDIAKAALEEKP